ncbi:sensor histidine kinase [Flavobacterium glaciei]|uniref:histidine kinase n=1 Tax=Flavobacterium glaciei TaxID=386300 RepID=A0A562PML3_9FLAO|nr:HAMP domain-containing sensor histidine kinase [Flavobacterium glaciei]RDI52371.1 two-component system phosphate regulon sensor histidine kinase PhoR [Flavobacterium glaciei]TWI45659.1 two-component system phosphate regulon sensor histidine kinase PhoR [Flavobacterium glaciei]
MKNIKTNLVVCFITVVIIITVAIQLFWNIKNYEENKRRLLNDVHTAFEKSVTNYYELGIKDDYVIFINQDANLSESDFFDQLIKSNVFKKEISKGKKKPTNKESNSAPSLYVSYDVTPDSLILAHNELQKKEMQSLTKTKDKNLKTRTLKGIKTFDSIASLKNKKNTISFATVRDSIDFQFVSKSFDNELKNKDIKLSYRIEHYRSNALFDHYKNDINSILPLKIKSNSKYLPKNEELVVRFSNPKYVLFKYSLAGILLSLILSLSVISCLLYLVHIIKKQKKIDAIKSDLISNITHEFKTPITTASAALEGIKFFNNEKDIDKTNRYIEISQSQLKKLEILVEEFLETAYLENEQLQLEKQRENIVPLLYKLVDTFAKSNPNKIFKFETNIDSILLDIDLFHFENAISNLIDNAIKYGGDSIKINLNKNHDELKIIVSDNGNGIAKKNLSYIFDKFFRESEGNIHTVKGFGIGLFYTKKIIEKHGGVIQVESSPNLTNFTIYLNDKK